jgi:hypothetical protein
MVTEIAAQGAVVIDTRRPGGWTQDVPLIVPEVNADAIARLHQEEHHRQSELFDRSACRGAEAVAREGEDQARRGCDLSIGIRRRQGRDGRTVLAEQGRVYAR